MREGKLVEVVDVSKVCTGTNFGEEIFIGDRGVITEVDVEEVWGAEIISVELVDKNSFFKIYKNGLKRLYNFEKGDYVKGTSNRYNITGVDMTVGLVEEVCESLGEMEVKVIEQRRRDSVGKCYDVENSTDYFEILPKHKVNVGRKKTDIENKMDKYDIGDMVIKVDGDSDIYNGIELGVVIKKGEDALKVLILKHQDKHNEGNSIYIDINYHNVIVDKEDMSSKNLKEKYNIGDILEFKENKELFEIIGVHDQFIATKSVTRGGRYKAFAPSFYYDLKLKNNDDNKKEVYSLLLDKSELKHLIQDRTLDVDALKNEIARHEAMIEDAKRRMAISTKEIKEARRKIKEEQNRKVNYDKVRDNLKQILEDDKVVSLKVDEDTITIDTVQLFAEGVGAYEGGKFELNRYRIKIIPRENKVLIQGLDDDLCRESCWSSRDPHPHVSGNSSYVCWGNTLAMLCDSMAQEELYMTYMLVINFLETYNLDDEAGVNIVNWDYINENGERVKLEKAKRCYSCEELLHDEDDVFICDECGDTFCSSCVTYSKHHEMYLCEYCIDNDYVRNVGEDNDIVHADQVVECYECGNYVISGNEIDLDGDTYCSHECISNAGYEQCDECGELGKCYYIDDRMLCSSCKEELEEDMEDEEEC